MRILSPFWQAGEAVVLFIRVTSMFDVDMPEKPISGENAPKETLCISPAVNVATVVPSLITVIVIGRSGSVELRF
jgi:hypothetical protein